MNTPKPILFKSLYGIAVCLLLGFYLLHRAHKEKAYFLQASGTVVYFGNGIEGFPNKDTAKFRYLQINTYPKPFELFIGKDHGDFKPEFESVDAIKAGDNITVYFDENFKTKDDPVNRLVYFIDRGQESLFVKGSWEQYMAYFIIGLSLLILFVLVMLKKKGKIS